MPNNKKKQKNKINIQLATAQLILLASILDLLKVIIEKFL
ncbi:hypothetical protein ANS017_10310 [Paraclostridium bifermentans]|nr:hypothetical protein ANS014_12270 [Paraclostridium bifermentans]GKZ07466.1 hypothetical protein ANS015_23490 [Paraclostridium bifermentans]GKZ09647.1 hypothetical protein ANS017_10310 [Paraclostridium bifermentans]